MEIPVYGAPRVASLASEMGLLSILIIIKKGSVCTQSDSLHRDFPAASELVVFI